MFELDDVIGEAEMNQSFTVLRSTGEFAPGGFTSTTTTQDFDGIISVATEKDMRQVPEGDRIEGAMAFWSTSEIYVTRNAASSEGLSDVLVWRGENYRVIKVFPYGDYDYFKAIAARMTGD